MEPRAVPKFASFRPKRAKPSEVQSDDASERELVADERPHRGPRGESRHESPPELSNTSRYRGSHAQTRTLHERRERQQDLAPKATMTSGEPEESPLFIIDRRGDRYNVEYGSLHRYSISAYHRTGRGRVLGTPSSVKISDGGGTDHELRLTSVTRHAGAKNARPLTAKTGRSNERSTRLVKHRYRQDGDTSDSDYIALDPFRKRRRTHDEDMHEESELTSVNYRSIEGKAKVCAQPDDADLVFTSSDPDSTWGEDSGSQLRQENAGLLRTARDDPRQLQHWLALVDHQAKLSRADADVSALTTAERRSLADLRLSVLREASTHITKDHPNRERLLEATIREGSFVWDRATLKAKWKEALVECPSSMVLWIGHLNFVQDEHTTFQYDSCLEAHKQCFVVLKNAYQQADDDSKSSINRALIHTLLRFTCFVRDAGHEELGIATWQALIEYHFFKPARLRDAPHEECVKCFEAFWEAEVPRFGEENAMGWKDYDENRRDAIRVSSTPATPSLDQTIPLSSLAEHEIALSGHVLPASVDADDGILDPFRCTIFSDIAGILDSIGGCLTSRALLGGFLSFHGLPDLPATEGGLDARDWLRDPHLATPMIPSRAKFWQSPPGVDSATVRHQLEMTETLFHNAFDKFRLGNERPSVMTDFIDKCLESLVATAVDDHVLAEYLLAFQSATAHPKTMRNAKRLLKARPTSLRLYNAYAWIEAHAGNVGKALEVWSQALKLSSNSEERVILEHSRVLALMQSGDETWASKYMLAQPDGIVDSESSADGSIRQLKAMRAYEESFDRTLLAGHYLHAVRYCDSLAWLVYLVRKDHNTSAPLRIYQRFAGRLSKEGHLLGEELLQQSKVRLLQHHLQRRRPFRPESLRQDLELSLSKFPSNSVLLQMHSQIVARDRLRALFRAQTAADSTDLTTVQYSFRIADEMQRAAHAAGSTAESIRATFSSALMRTSSTVKHTPFLWMLWLRFEYSRAIHAPREQRQRLLRAAKLVFFDGLRALPWMKKWILFGLQLFSDVCMSNAELRSVCRLLTERGLRVRTSMAEALLKL